MPLLPSCHACIANVCIISVQPNMIVMHSIEQTDTCAMKLQLLFMVVKHANKTQVKDMYNNTLEEKFTNQEP